MDVRNLLEFIRTDRYVRSLGLVILVLFLMIHIEKRWLVRQDHKMADLKAKKALIASVLKNTSSEYAVAPGLGAYQLTGISKDKDKTFAIINNDIYCVNDRLGDFVIKDIGENVVTLQNIKTQEIGRLNLYTPEEAAIYLSSNNKK